MKMLTAILLILSAGAFAQDRRVTPAVGGRRLALLVGNADYPAARLKNPENDVRRLAASLRESGFEVASAVNLDLRALDRAIGGFVANVHAGDTALFYYSGHGQQVEGENFFVPIDFRGEQEADVPYQA